MKQSTFTNLYNHISNVVEFDASWNNGTGYYDGIVGADLNLKAGELGKSFSGGENRRRLIIVGTRFGNVGIFDRYTDQDQKDMDSNIIVVHNGPRQLRGWVKETALSDADLDFLAGSEWNENNIGKRVENVFIDNEDRISVKTFDQAVMTLCPKIVEGKFDVEVAMAIASEELRWQTSGRVLMSDDCGKEILYVKNFNPSIQHDVLFIKTYQGRITMLENPNMAIVEGIKPTRVSAKKFVEMYNNVFDGTFPISVVE